MYIQENRAVLKNLEDLVALLKSKAMGDLGCFTAQGYEQIVTTIMRSAEESKTSPKQ